MFPVSDGSRSKSTTKDTDSRGTDTISNTEDLDSDNAIQSSHSKLVRFCIQVQVFIIPSRTGNSMNQFRDKKVNFYPVVTNIIIPGRKHISNLSDLWYNSYEIQKFDKVAFSELKSELEPNDHGYYYNSGVINQSELVPIEINEATLQEPELSRHIKLPSIGR